MKKRILSFVLVLVMLVGMIPMGAVMASADEATADGATVSFYGAQVRSSDKAVRFIGIIDDYQAAGLQELGFVINFSLREAEAKVTKVYTSIEGGGKVYFADEDNPDSNKKFFTFCLTDVPKNAEFQVKAYSKVKVSDTETAVTKYSDTYSYKFTGNDMVGTGITLRPDNSIEDTSTLSEILNPVDMLGGIKVADIKKVAYRDDALKDSAERIAAKLGASAESYNPANNYQIILGLAEGDTSFSSLASNTAFVTSNGAVILAAAKGSTALNLFAAKMLESYIDDGAHKYVFTETANIISAESDFETVYEKVANGQACAIVGAGDSTVLTLPETVSLKGHLMIDNVKLSGESTIYANGYTLMINENVTSTNRLTVYGGANGKAVKSTNITLLGGLYTTVWGGGLKGAVTGSTNVFFGGNANKGDGIDDSDESTLSPCNVYGGGNQATVGESNVTIAGNAVAQYVSGVGNNNVDAVNVPKVNIYIIGGKVMNVYGCSINTGLEVSNTLVNITMTGGLVESIMGGSNSKNVEGNIYINLLGGEVSRRVFTGCYNASISTQAKITGTTTLTIGAAAKLCTGTGLSFSNSLDKQVWCGSRYVTSGETNYVIYLDGVTTAQNLVKNNPTVKEAP